MKRLILMRHAKSDWSGGAGSDHDRPLNGRGRDAAATLGRWIKAEGLLPDEVLSSSAARTGETLLRLGLPEGAKTRFTRDLYLATHHAILKELRTALGDIVLMIGHNPGIAMMADGVLEERPTHPKFDQYPTGATLVADFEIDDWAQAGWGNAIARHFVVPRDL